MDQVIVATAPSPLRAGGCDSWADRRECAGVLRCHRAIVHRESIDFERAWFQSRYDKAGPAGDGADYINCSLDKTPYLAFVEALLAGEKTEFKRGRAARPTSRVACPSR